MQFQGDKLSEFFLPDGTPVYTQEYVQALRDEDMKHPGSLRAFIAQKGAQERMLATDVDILIGGGSRGGPLLVDTKVVTPFGYRRIGDLKAGDIISGTDGGVQRVVYRKDHGKLPAYKLKFVDGSEVIASYDHLWNVRKGYNSVDDEYKVWTTQEIVCHIANQDNNKLTNQIFIPICNPVKFSKPIGKRYAHKTDPYIIGIVLGYGLTADTLERYNYERLQSDLKGLGLLSSDGYHDFLPEYYKFESIDIRWRVLQGLMDSCGEITDCGECLFLTANEHLANDVKFLVDSLGGLATISDYDNDDGSACEHYSVCIEMENPQRLFRDDYKRHRCLLHPNRGYKSMRRIVGFEYVGEQECCCIAVNNTNSLFMVEDFIVTHNSKSFSMLMQSLYDVLKPGMTAVLLRKETKDLDSLINDSYKLYSDFGVYNRSLNDMTWNFNNGGWLKFSYYAGNYQAFKDRFQGRQYSYVGIDEITQCEYRKFKYLTTVNRNASGLRSRFWGTCNPDPDSWVRKFIDWWIDEDGYAIPERCGRVRYCYMDGDSPDSIYWGNTREEVYQQCAPIIDSVWNDQYEQVFAKFGLTKLDVIIKSVTFIRADLSENIKLLASDPSYLGNLAQQDEEQRMRDLQANWNWKAAGDDMIKYEDMEGFFHNAMQLGDGVRRASADIAFQGGDNFVMWLWVGNHIKDLVVMRLDSKTVVSVVKAKLREWGVEDKNFTYDMQGIGQYFKGFFPDALPFNNQMAPVALTRDERDGIKYLYKDLKSQCAFLFYEDIKNGAISIERSLLERKFSGNGFKHWTLERILQKERKAIRRDEGGDDRGFKILAKKTAKKYVGWSPDFMESCYYWEYPAKLAKKTHTKVKNLWMFG